MNATAVVGWAPEPQTRGTIGLIWSCLATILLCTWNTIHPNLPAEGESALRIFGRRVVYVVIALVAPEALCSQAMLELADARAIQKQASPMEPLAIDILTGSKLSGWSLAQCFYLRMGGFVVRGDGPPILVTPKTLLRLLDTNVLSLSDVTESEILDRSKADWVLKSLALVQATWFTAQVIGRAAQGLSVTTLELFTLGVISCALVTYIAWWAKPFDVRRPIILKPKKALPNDMETMARQEMWDRAGISASDWPVVMTICATLVFGALHLVGWRFYFPTDIEKWLWRGSSIACITLPLAVLVTNNSISIEFWHDLLRGSIIGLYVSCRCYMMVEMFVSLRAVPADVYKTPQWSQYFPSFG